MPAGNTFSARSYSRLEAVSGLGHCGVSAPAWGKANVITSAGSESRIRRRAWESLVDGGLGGTPFAARREGGQGLATLLVEQHQTVGQQRGPDPRSVLQRLGPTQAPPEPSPLTRHPAPPAQAPAHHLPH